MKLNKDLELKKLEAETKEEARKEISKMRKAKGLCKKGQTYYVVVPKTKRTRTQNKDDSENDKVKIQSPKTVEQD